MDKEVLKNYLDEIDSNIETLLNIKKVEKGIYKTTCLKNKNHTAYYNPATKKISCHTCRYEMELVPLSASIVGVSEEEMLLSILINKLKKNRNELIDLMKIVKEQKSKKEIYYQANREALELYKEEFKKNQFALKYVFETRKMSKEVVNKFQIGFAPKGNIILKKLAPKYGKEKLYEIGLLAYNPKNNQYFDRFNNRIMFPVFDVNNRVIAFGGRTMGNSSPKYLNTATTEVFQKSYELYGLNYLEKGKKYPYIICSEGYMDVIALHQEGICNVVANLGTAFTENHLNILSKYTNNIILMLDGDDAGINGMKRVLCKVGAVNTLILPDNLDPDEYIKKFSRESLLEYIENNKKSWEQSMCDILIREKEKEPSINIFESLIKLKEF